MMIRFLTHCFCALLALGVMVLASDGQESARRFYTPPSYPFYAPPSYSFYAAPPYSFYAPSPHPFYAPPAYPFYAPPTGQTGQPFFAPFTPLEKLRPLNGISP